MSWDVGNLEQRSLQRRDHRLAGSTWSPVALELSFCREWTFHLELPIQLSHRSTVKVRTFSYMQIWNRSSPISHVPFQEAAGRCAPSNGRLKQEVGKWGLGCGGDQEKRGKMPKGNHCDRHQGNLSTREQGMRALEGRKSMQRISCLVSVNVFWEGCVSAESLCELVTSKQNQANGGKMTLLMPKKTKRYIRKKGQGLYAWL